VTAAPSLPLIELDGPLTTVLTEAGATPADLYRVLANQPVLLEGWLRLAGALRNGARTSRATRELMILRAAQLMNASYQWRDHREMARVAGVADGAVQALAHWQASDLFDVEQRTALALVDAMIQGHVPQEVLLELTERFSASDALELILTAGFYCMVPRVLDALRLSADVEVPRPFSNNNDTPIKGD